MGRLASSERCVWLWGVNDGQTWRVDLAVDDGEVAHDSQERQNRGDSIANK